VFSVGWFLLLSASKKRNGQRKDILKTRTVAGESRNGKTKQERKGLLVHVCPRHGKAQHDSRQKGGIPHWALGEGKNDEGAKPPEDEVRRPESSPWKRGRQILGGGIYDENRNHVDAEKTRTNSPG